MPHLLHVCPDVQAENILSPSPLLFNGACNFHKKNKTEVGGGWFRKLEINWESVSTVFSKIAVK